MVNTKRSKSPWSVLIYGSRGGCPYFSAYLPTTLTSIPVHASSSLFVCVTTGMSFFSMFSSAHNKGENNASIIKATKITVLCLFLFVASEFLIIFISEQVLYHL